MNHLKQTFICAFTATMLCAPMQAQTSKAELLANMELATGNYCTLTDKTKVEIGVFKQ